MTTQFDPRNPDRAPARPPLTAGDALVVLYAVLVGGSVVFTGRWDFLWRRGGHDSLTVGLYWLCLQVLVAHASVAWVSRQAAEVAREFGISAWWLVPSPAAMPSPLLYLPAIGSAVVALLVQRERLGVSALVSILFAVVYCALVRAGARSR